MKVILKKTAETLERLKHSLKKTFNKVNVHRMLFPKSYRRKESDKQHGFTFRNENHKGPKF